MRLPEPTVHLLAEFVPEPDLRRMQVVTAWPLRWLPSLLGMAAITFSPFVVMRAGHYRTDTARGLALIAHEAIHIGQVRNLGWRFYPRYLWGQLQCGFRHDSHPMEIPCIELQRQVRRTLDHRGGGGSW